MRQTFAETVHKYAEPMNNGAKVNNTEPKRLILMDMSDKAHCVKSCSICGGPSHFAKSLTWQCSTVGCPAYHVDKSVDMVNAPPISHVEPHLHTWVQDDSASVICTHPPRYGVKCECGATAHQDAAGSICCVNPPSPHPSSPHSQA